MIALAALPARGETRAPYGGTATAALLGEPVHVDPVDARSHAETTLVGLVFDTLYRAGDRDARGRVQVEPHVAAALPTLAGAALVRIPIRPGIVFHDGTPLQPGDVAASLQRLQASRAGWLVAMVEGIEHDTGDVLLRLRRPVPVEEIGLALSAPAAAITPGGKAPGARAPVGSGPFRVQRLDRRRSRIQLAAHDRHFAGRPFLDRLDLRWFEGANREAAAYEVGALALSQRGAVAYAGHRPKYETHEATGPATLLVYAGAGRAGAMAHPEARRALSLALDREGMRGIGTGERVVPAVDPVPVAIGGPAASTEARHPRLDRAAAALARAAAADARLASILDRGRSRGRSRSVEILIDRTRPDDREIAEKLAAALFRLDVPARITALAAGAWHQRVRRGDADLYIGHMALPAPAPGLTLAAAFSAGNDGWARARMERGALAPDAARRAFAERLPVIPLFHRAVRTHHRSDLRGVILDAAARPGFADLFFFGPAVPAR